MPGLRSTERPDPQPDPDVVGRLGRLGLPAGADGLPERSRTPHQEPGAPLHPELPPAASSPPAAGDLWRAALADRLPPWATAMRASAGGAALLTLTLICVTCLAITSWTVLHHRSALPLAPPPYVASTPFPAPTPTVEGIVVDVGGRVRHPGLVTLSPGARVADALDAAGGALRPRDVATMDLAARVNDGELLLVGLTSTASGAAAGSGASSSQPAGPVNLNSATIEQLDTLPGIGPVLAQRIVDYRTTNGPFAAVDDLNDVSGIGDTIFAELAPLVAV
jgi:competence protein ComEA